jgi:hypothetical protein
MQTRFREPDGFRIARDDLTCVERCQICMPLKLGAAQSARTEKPHRKTSDERTRRSGDHAD